ncbi:MAG: EAL domain-containing protein [Gallionellaceae bacterium]|jgi:diguanylate cyclase (GGDEF)-like protein/PAS domain S-box-containing protein
MFKPSQLECNLTLDHKVAFLNSVFLLAGIVAFLMGFYRWQISVVMGSIDFAFALSSFALVYYLNHHKERVATISSIALALSYCLFSAIYLLSPYNTTRISLFFLLSASAFFLKGRQAGLVWLILILLTIVTGHFLPGFDTAYSHFDIVTACLYLMALFFILRNYEMFNEKINERNRKKELLHLSEERFRTMVESGNDIIGIVSNTGMLHFISSSVEPVLGFAPGEILNKHVNELIHPDEQAKATQALADVLCSPAGKGLKKHEFRARHKDGGYRIIEIIGRNLINNPVIGGIVLNGRDITERKQAEEKLRLTTKVFENTQEGITITDILGNIIEINAALSKITGYSREELIGKNPRMLQSGHQSRSFYEAMWQSLTTTGHWAGEVWNRKKDGEMYAAWLTISAIVDEHGKTTHYVGISSDITLLKQHEKQLERIAHYDALTGIPNRTLLNDRMKQAIARTAREKNMMAVCYLDLDGFKPINDTVGHDAGDHVLIEIARRIQNTLRGGDTVARLGGDEFVILLLGLERGEECNITLERMLAVIAEPIDIKGNSFSLSASIGVSIYPLDEEDTDTLLRHADQAMYVAKQSGKNRFHIYDPALDQRTRNQQELLKNIQLGLQNNQFELYYQPKVDLRTQQLVGAEALIRWNHPELGLLAPARFLPVAENTEIDIAIGEWVIASALHQLDLWRVAGLDIEVSINISAHHLESAHFVDRLQQQFLQHPAIPAKRFQIEVLETAALDDITQVTRILDECKKFGVCFALDDFGTGYSSLSYLSTLPIDALKIDQSFIRNLTLSKGDHAIVLGVIALSKVFDLKTVAEGIETQVHFHTLLEMGCDIGQGYGIARPMPASALLDWANRTAEGISFFQLSQIELNMKKETP